MGIAQQLRQWGKATEGILKKLLPPEPGMEELAAAVGYVENAGSPYNSLTPDFIGQRLLDTTNNVWYRAYGVTSTTWRPDMQGVLDASGNITGLAGVGGTVINLPIDGLSTTNSAAAATANTTRIQAALTAGGQSQITTPGTYLSGNPLLLGSNTTLALSAGVTLKGGNTIGHTIIRTGNAEFDAAASSIPGVWIYCADEQAAGAGTLLYTHSGTTLTWTAPGDTAGTAVDISSVVSTATAAIFKCASGTAGKAIYVAVAVSASRTANVSRTVNVVGTTGAKSVTWSRTSNVRTATETAHGRKPGDFVINFSSTGADFHGYIIDVTADTWTIANTGSNTTGSGTVYGVRNIRILGNGAVIDYNKAGTTGNFDGCELHATILHAVSDAVVEGLQINNATKYALLLSGFKNVSTTRIESFRTDSSDLSGNSDTIHICGPGRVFRASQTRAQGGDNIFGVGTGDYVLYTLHFPAYGSLTIEDYDLGDVWAENTDQEPVRLYGANAGILRNGRVGPIGGTYNTSTTCAFAIITDPSSSLVDGGATNIDGLTVVSPDATQSGESLAIKVSGSGTRRNIKVERLRPRANGTTYLGTVQVSGTLEDLTVEVDDTGTAFSAAVVTVTGTGSIGQFVGRAKKLVGDNTLNGSVRPSFLNQETSASVCTYVNIDVETLDDTSSSGSKIVLFYQKGLNTATDLRAGTIVDADTLYKSDSTATAGNTIRARDSVGPSSYVISADHAPAEAYAVNCKNTSGSIYNSGASSGTVLINLVNCNSASRLFRNGSNSATYRLKFANCVAFDAVQVVAGTPSIRLAGPCTIDGTFDGTLISSTVSQHAAGASFYNTAAGFDVGVGWYVRGSAAWSRLVS